MATTGQGSPPYRMRPLWREMLKKSFKLKEGVKFAIYSLGDRSYGENFGVTGRKMRQRLRMLGGEEIVEIGLGD
jgi:sulfite reductase alpha subunit-like flavoprotein